jgi:hypothetical protein
LSIVLLDLTIGFNIYGLGIEMLPSPKGNGERGPPSADPSLPKSSRFPSLNSIRKIYQVANLILYNLNKINFYGHHISASDGFFYRAVKNWLLHCGDKYLN